jgi:hypothetical protein
MENKTWDNYLARRLAFPIEPHNLHSLFCPDGMTETHNDSSANKIGDNQKSLAALQRIDNNYRSSFRSSLRSTLSEGLLNNIEQMKYEDELDVSNQQLENDQLRGIQEGTYGEDSSSYYNGRRDGGSTYDEENDDIESMSRAFSVGSIDNIDDEAGATALNQESLPQMNFDDSDYYDDQAFPQPPRGYHDDQGVFQQANQGRNDDEDVLAPESVSVPRYGNVSVTEESYFYFEDHQTVPQDNYDTKSDLGAYYDDPAPDYDETIESAPLIYDSKGDTNSIT